MNSDFSERYYRRHLPHLQQEIATYFITTRLSNSLPRDVVNQIKSEYELDAQSLGRHRNAVSTDEIIQRRDAYFKKFDQLLDSSSFGDQWLKRSDIAQIVADSLHHYDGRLYDLICFSIMPNHIHLIIDHNLRISKTSLEMILQSIKKFTARKANSTLGRSGTSFWQSESYDHIIRTDQELENMIRYVIYNPVSAALCKEWTEWRWTYLNDEFVSFFT
ncbi:MAG: transposase [Bacteroidota bacterium]